MDIRLQETHLRRVIIGYAGKTARAITTYKYQAPHGLNHSLADMHDEVMSYLVTPMLDDASALPPCIRNGTYCKRRLFSWSGGQTR